MVQQAEKTEEDLKRRALSEAGITYSVCAVLPVVATLILSLVLIGLQNGREDANWYASQDWYKYLTFLLPQICFAAACVVFFRRSKVSPRQTYCGCKWYWFPIAAVMQFGLMFSLSELNGLFVELLKLAGYAPREGYLPNLSGWNLLPALLVIAVLPALFEETVFRGIISKQMHENGWGLWACVLVSGALFALFHQNPEQTIYQFICGACFTLVALKAGSVLPTMVAHFLNNALVLSLVAGFAPGAGEDVVLREVLPAGGYAALCAVAAVCLVGSVVFTALFRRKKEEDNVKIEEGKAFFLAAAVGIGVCALFWILALANGIVKGIA